MRLHAFTITRSGQVKYRIAGAAHCGPADHATQARGLMTVNWTIACQCAPRLDARGFLFNQTALPNFVLRVCAHNPTLSCEALAARLGEEFIAKLARDVPTCRPRSLSVTLSPVPFVASVRADWIDTQGDLDL